MGRREQTRISTVSNCSQREQRERTTVCRKVGHPGIRGCRNISVLLLLPFLLPFFSLGGCPTLRHTVLTHFISRIFAAVTFNSRKHSFLLSTHRRMWRLSSNACINMCVCVYLYVFLFPVLSFFRPDSVMERAEKLISATVTSNNNKLRSYPIRFHMSSKEEGYERRRADKSRCGSHSPASQKGFSFWIKTCQRIVRGRKTGKRRVCEWKERERKTIKSPEYWEAVLSVIGFRRPEDREVSSVSRTANVCMNVCLSVELLLLLHHLSAPEFHSAVRHVLLLRLPDPKEI